MSPIVFNCHSKVNDLLPPSKLFENLKAVRSLSPDHQALELMKCRSAPAIVTAMLLEVFLILS